jgi:hypothetical protein
MLIDGTPGGLSDPDMEPSDEKVADPPLFDTVTVPAPMSMLERPEIVKVSVSVTVPTPIENSIIGVVIVTPTAERPFAVWPLQAST